jgi:hypothetical protein
MKAILLSFICMGLHLFAEISRQGCIGALGLVADVAVVSARSLAYGSIGIARARRSNLSAFGQANSI